MEAVDRFTDSMHAYPGRTMGQLYHLFFRVNEIAGGTLTLGRHTVDLAEVRIPVLSVAGASDVIAPAGRRPPRRGADPQRARRAAGDGPRRPPRGARGPLGAQRRPGPGSTSSWPSTGRRTLPCSPPPDRRPPARPRYPRRSNAANPPALDPLRARPGRPRGRPGADHHARHQRRRRRPLEPHGRPGRGQARRRAAAAPAARPGDRRGRQAVHAEDRRREAQARLGPHRQARALREGGHDDGRAEDHPRAPGREGLRAGHRRATSGAARATRRSASRCATSTASARARAAAWRSTRRAR